MVIFFENLSKEFGLKCCSSQLLFKNKIVIESKWAKNVFFRSIRVVVVVVVVEIFAQFSFLFFHPQEHFVISTQKLTYPCNRVNRDVNRASRYVLHTMQLYKLKRARWMQKWEQRDRQIKLQTKRIKMFNMFQIDWTWILILYNVQCTQIILYHQMHLSNAERMVFEIARTTK